MSSRCKILVDEVKDLVDVMGDTADEELDLRLAELVRQAELEIRQAQQLYHDVADLDETQWRLSFALGEHAKARSALERAWRKQPRGASVALRLARQYESDDKSKAANILQEALERFPDDKGVHFETARFLLRTEPELLLRVGEHLGRSYSQGDRNYNARHLHAQYLFAIGEARKAEALFQDVEERAPAEFRARTGDPDADLRRHIKPAIGRIVKKDSTYCFIRSPSYGSDIYANERDSDVSIWESIRAGTQVEFKVKFRRGGPVAHELRPTA